MFILSHISSPLFLFISLAAAKDIELEIVPSDDLSIGSDQGLTTTQQLPTSMALLQTLNVSASPFSVCEYKEDIYVGLDNNRVARIDSNYQVYESFIRCTGRVESVSVYKDSLNVTVSVT